MSSLVAVSAGGFVGFANLLIVLAIVGLVIVGLRNRPPPDE